MSTVYSDIPHNWNLVEGSVICDSQEIIEKLFLAEKVLFYDTCSFRYHSNLKEVNKKQLAEFFLQKKMVIVLAKTIIMELASYSGFLEKSYIDFIKELRESGITIITLKEENLFELLSVCFSTNEAVNSYLLWAVRSLKAPVSTITETLQKDTLLNAEVKMGLHQASSDIYNHFFQKVRNNKESGDNLGEEILAICLHILSHVPGMKDGKLCVITEDKGGAGKINWLMQATNRYYKGARIIIYSTPKLIQTMIYSNIKINKEDLSSFLRADDGSNIVITGTTEYDFHSCRNISLTKSKLVELLMESGKINILF